MANSRAEKKPSVLNVSIRLSTNKTISTVIMKETRPSVRKLIGKVKMRRMVPIVALARAIKSPARMALQKFVTSTPGKRYAAIVTATPINSISMISLIFLL